MYWRFPPRSGLFLRCLYLFSSIFGAIFTTISTKPGIVEKIDPKTFEEAFGHSDWDEAMNEEYCSLLANNTWDLVPLPKGRKNFR